MRGIRVTMVYRTLEFSLEPFLIDQLKKMNLGNGDQTDR